jgi:hypothetical protein
MHLPSMMSKMPRNIRNSLSHIDCIGSMLYLDSKRKAEEKQADSSASKISVVSDGELMDMNVDEEIDKAIRKIREGSHEELQQRAYALEQEKQKHIAAADRHRQDQIKNINQLFEYEVEDAQALYNVRDTIALFGWIFYLDKYIIYNYRKLIVSYKNS